MKKLQTTMLVGLILALAILASGCSDANERSSNRVQLGLATDDAYLTVLAAQNTTAYSYSQEILNTNPDKQIAAFARSAIGARNKESEQITKLQRDVDPSGMSYTAAAEQLGYSLEQLGITASGQPLAAPATHDGYLKAMTSIDKAGILASNAEIKNGSPGVVPFAKNVVVQRTGELATLKDLK